MNDMIRQLATFAPALVAQLKGNPDALAEFTRGYQTTLEQQQQMRLREQAASMAVSDRETQQAERERMLARQAEQDQIAGEERNYGKYQDALKMLGQLVPAQETMEGAESMSQGVLAGVPPSVREMVAPMADAQLRQVPQMITGRQKKAVEAYVEAALKTSFVADNPDHDPELAQLPEHIAKILGKPSAKLSELQAFAQLPVGKPQGKTRTPAAVGSFEDYVAKKYGEAPTSEQIIEARKVYNQADDRAPRVTVNTGDKIDKNAALKFQDDYARDSKPYLLLRDAYQRVKSAKPDAAGDLSLIFAYMKILDPNSVVREQEFANAQNAAGVPDQIRNLYNRVKDGVRLNPEQRKQFLSQAEALFENAKTNQKQVRGTYSNRAKQWGIPENMVLDDDPLMVDAPKGPKIGDPVIDKKTGATVYVTGVRPDGGLIVSPVKPE